MRDVRQSLEAIELAPDLMLVAGPLAVNRQRSTVEVAFADGSATARADAWTAPSEGMPSLGLIDLQSVGARAAAVRTVELDGGAVVGVVWAADIAALLRGGLSSAPQAARESVLDFLLEATARARSTPVTSISSALVIARKVLRERLPSAAVDRHLPRGGHVELLARLDPQTVYVRGWIAIEHQELKRVTLVSPEGARALLPPTTYHFDKPDVAGLYQLEPGESCDFGFAALCELPVASLHDEGWLIEIETHAGRLAEMACPPAVSALREVRRRLVGELTVEPFTSQALRVHHLLPGVLRVQERLAANVRVRHVEQFGDVPAHPDVSVVVPLYLRLEFVEHQLAQFVHDQDLKNVDLIYVLDSPEQHRELLDQCERLYRLYGVAFRVAVLSANGGFSMANNLGASLARGRLLLLMNSDVLPDRPGWLSALVQFHDSIADVGAVGPKLLYEDDSIQHAGMTFERPPGSRTWLNGHPFKGLHRSFAPATTSRRVPAVTAACLLVDLERYRGVGGLKGAFVQGDFEDSDLCLRLHDQGLQNWYCADVELYHLEGQSYPSQERRNNGQFNRWFHTHLWDECITEIMAAEPEWRAAGEAPAGRLG